MKALARWLGLGFGLGLLLSLAPSCGPKPCGPASCTGCCDPSGKCQAGTLNVACGASGGSCITCGATDVCQAGLCSGGSGGGGGGGGGAGGGGGGSGNISQDAFCNGVAEAWWTQMVTCKSADPSAKSDLVAYLKRYFCEGPTAASISKGYLTYDPAAAASCVTQLENAAADCTAQIFASGASCSRVFAPNVNTGGACLNTQSGSYFPLFGAGECKDRTESCGGTGCAGTCQGTGGLGEPCQYGSYCNTGAWCDAAANLCKAPRPAGSSCTSAYGSECDANSYCDTVAKLCVALPTAGSPCRSSSYPACASTAWCDYSSTPDTCRAYLAQNQSCTSSTACGPTAFCDYSQSSTCQPRKTVGASCGTSSECQETLTCKSSLCTAPAGLGGACQSINDCEASLTCDQVLQTCQKYAPVPEGGACTGYALYCTGLGIGCKGVVKTSDGGVGTAGTCQPLLVGEVCASNSGCPTATYCSRPDGGAGTCQGAGSGTPCDDNDNCLKAHYCKGTACAPRLVKDALCDPQGSEACVSPLVCKTAAGDAGVCGEMAGAGASCIVGGDQQCLLPYECIGGSCTRVATSGARCASSGYCFTGACQGRDDAGSAGTCGAYLGAGAPCVMWIECASQRCDNGQCAAACQ